eukprot:COSAG02_NODE_994_length_15358_cov_42.651812_11_plen_154_part_00
MHLARSPAAGEVDVRIDSVQAAPGSSHAARRSQTMCSAWLHRKKRRKRMTLAWPGMRSQMATTNAQGLADGPAGERVAARARRRGARVAPRARERSRGADRSIAAHRAHPQAPRRRILHVHFSMHFSMNSHEEKRNNLGHRSDHKGDSNHANL